MGMGIVTKSTSVSSSSSELIEALTSNETFPSTLAPTSHLIFFCFASTSTIAEQRAYNAAFPSMANTIGVSSLRSSLTITILPLSVNATLKSISYSLCHGTTPASTSYIERVGIRDCTIFCSMSESGTSSVPTAPATPPA